MTEHEVQYKNINYTMHNPILIEYLLLYEFVSVAHPTDTDPTYRHIIMQLVFFAVQTLQCQETTDTNPILLMMNT